ncbi:MFS transporter, DHA1 family, bicyclomycin/chloramphenicol resistance protein [Pseudoxanthobacter soli DSM 19599]|uniref:Bcr/CflA family efflux transporter n=1 Tax=Pseudoxanthobacter soli DSM 19599 TaxID=1123029 RepID=A0A1M7ZBQ6_9HYPH|nr:multidrug effflux MFS transporter [Pseudoxanthobacter soli]SHO62338.1 MFS transporter, DHA1 family, bicyclomycin/chloramphenicol resistance protein [Pseudoxanthobacter soli DSM 19599]
MVRPGTLAFTAMLASLSAMSPVATDIYLPSLPAIVAAFGTTPAAVQVTLSVFMFGYAVAMPVYGPLSDRFGRRPVLLVSLGLFVITSLIAPFSPSINVLIALRFVQALGAAGPVILSRSIVRDVFSGPRAVKELSRMGSIAGLVPSLAPTLGGVLGGLFGWQSSFYLMGVVSAAILAFIALKMPETVPERMPSISFPAVFRSFGVCLRSVGFRVYTAICCLCFAGLFAYISGTSFVLQGHYGLGQVAFGIAFAATAVSFIVGTLIGARLSARMGIVRGLGFGTALNAAGGVLILLGSLFGPGHPLEIIIPMMIYMVGIGIGMPQGTAGAIMPFPERAGAASSLLGVLQMGSGALSGILVGHLVGAAVWPFTVVIMACGLAALGVDLATRRRRLAAPVRSAGR